MNLELTEEEREFLTELLDRSLRNLKEEIYKAEDYAYKESLKQDERLLLRLLERLR